MKKFLSILLALAMVLALAACGASEPAPAATEAPKAEAPAATEAPAAPAEKELITVGFAQVGHESDWRMANTADYQAVFSVENGYDLMFVDCDNDNAV